MIIAEMLRGKPAAGARRGDFAGYGGRFADMPAARAPHEVDVNMIVVIDIGAGREHGRKLIAGRRLHVVQKSLLLGRAVPALLHLDHVAVGEIELGDVERVAEGMLGNMRVRIAVHAAAGIGGDLLDLDNGLAKPAHRGGLN